MKSIKSLAPVGVLLASTAPVFAGAPQVQTLRLNISSTPLAIYNFAQFEDYPIPGLDATVIATRIHLEFHTQTFFGEFDAANFGLALIAPIDAPEPGDALVSHAMVGSELGWAGSGEFVYDAPIPIAGELLTPGFPGAPLFFGLDYFHPFNVTDPPPANPMQLGGQLFNSYFEIDYILDVPAPGAVTALAPAGLLAARRRRR